MASTSIWAAQLPARLQLYREAPDPQISLGIAHRLAWANIAYSTILQTIAVASPDIQLNQQSTLL
jgi:hypothetical protein